MVDAVISPQEHGLQTGLLTKVPLNLVSIHNYMLRVQLHLYSEHHPSPTGKIILNGLPLSQGLTRMPFTATKFDFGNLAGYSPLRTLEAG